MAGEFLRTTGLNRKLEKRGQAIGGRLCRLNLSMQPCQGPEGTPGRTQGGQDQKEAVQAQTTIKHLPYRKQTNTQQRKDRQGFSERAGQCGDQRHFAVVSTQIVIFNFEPVANPSFSLSHFDGTQSLQGFRGHAAQLLGRLE